MPYYGAGDYYRGDCNYGAGDYYRGDSIFSKIGRGIKKVAGLATNLLPGPAGAVARALVGPTSRQLQLPASAGAQAGSKLHIGLLPPEVTIERFGPGPGPMPQLPGPLGSMTPQGFLPGCQMKGYRTNKSGYYKQVEKGNPFAAVYIPKGSVCVKSRRINIANPRALRRAVRRAQGFAKMARRVMTFVSAKAPKGRAKFKRGR